PAIHTLSLHDALPISSYAALVGRLSGMPIDPEAWNALLSSGATHAIVHEGAFVYQGGRAVSEWLRRYGARETAALQTDRVFQLRSEEHTSELQSRENL